MTSAADAIVVCLRRGIELLPADGGASLLARGPATALTPALRDAIRAHKREILRVLPRLASMRALGVDLTGRGIAPPTPVAVWPAPPAGPGCCFSCGASLDPPRAYGRCEWCAIAAEVFWATRRPRPDEIAPPGPARPPDPDEPQFITLPTAGGGLLTLPRGAVEFALALEARGFVLRVAEDGETRLVVEPDAALTPAERAALARWQPHLTALVAAAQEARA